MPKGRKRVNKSTTVAERPAASTVGTEASMPPFPVSVAFRHRLYANYGIGVGPHGFRCFQNGFLVLTDQSEIDAVRAHPEYGKNITEVTVHQAVTGQAPRSIGRRPGEELYCDLCGEEASPKFFTADSLKEHRRKIHGEFEVEPAAHMVRTA